MKLVIELGGDELPADLIKHMNYYIDNWSDGRYPFSVELLKRGLDECIEHAIRESIREEMIKKYGDQYVTHSNGKTALWHIKAEKTPSPKWWFKELKVEE